MWVLRLEPGFFARVARALFYFIYLFIIFFIKTVFLAEFVNLELVWPVSP